MLNTETFRYSLLFRGMKCKTFPDRGGYTDQFFQKTDSMKVHVKHQLQKKCTKLLSLPCFISVQIQHLGEF